MSRTLIQHYADTSFAADVEASLKALGLDPARITFDDLAAVDEFHMGGRPATRALLSACGFKPGFSLADIGSGLGGPARVAAAEFGCTVEGVDLTPAYVAVANDLSRRVGLDARTRFVVGSALSPALAAAPFDGATMIHVGMNIADKAALMRAVRSVLKSGAIFGIYDIMRVGEGDLTYPLPWSSVAETSAVATPADYRAALTAARFEIVDERNRRPDLAGYAAAMGGKATPPTLPHRGAAWETKTANLAALVKGGTLAPVQILARALGD